MVTLKLYPLHLQPLTTKSSGYIRRFDTAVPTAPRPHGRGPGVRNFPIIETDVLLLLLLLLRRTVRREIEMTMEEDNTKAASARGGTGRMRPISHHH
jgi:hypothetical protein